MKTKRKILTIITIASVLCLAATSWAGNRKMMAMTAAKADAARGLVEQVMGLKVRAEEKVVDMAAGSYVGKTESKTSATVRGIQYEEVVYDPAQDIAKATATLRMDQIVNIDGDTVDLSGKVFRYVGFGAGSPSTAGPLRALRAAIIDAHKQIAQAIAGFTLESQTTVENYMLKSDLIESKVLATTALAKLTDYGWDESGDAYAKLTLDVKEVSEMLGEQVIDGTEVIVVEGNGAQEDDFSKAQTK
jgi:hypothetical protein